MGRPMLARLLAGAMATAAIVTVSGCSGEQPAPTSAPVDTAASTPTPAATFASDEEALSAGVAAVERAHEMTVDLVSDPGKDLSSIDAVAVGSYAETMRETVNKMRDDKTRLEGRLSFRGDKVVQTHESASEGVELQFYACVDRTDFHRYSPDGVKLDERPGDNKTYMIISVEGEDAGSLKVSEAEVWSHEQDC